ncbi:hypothetical protein [Caudoviricetes sp.]|nr:hypothetical protein [Caudoviricetes sp.]
MLSFWFSLLKILLTTTKSRPCFVPFRGISFIQSNYKGL